jgi:hypothetical protein
MYAEPNDSSGGMVQQRTTATVTKYCIRGRSFQSDNIDPTACCSRASVQSRAKQPTIAPIALLTVHVPACTSFGQCAGIPPISCQTLPTHEWAECSSESTAKTAGAVSASERPVHMRPWHKHTASCSRPNFPSRCSAVSASGAARSLPAEWGKNWHGRRRAATRELAAPYRAGASHHLTPI